MQRHDYVDRPQTRVRHRFPWFWVVLGLLLVSFVYSVLTNERNCVTACNGRCHTRCEPSLIDKWFK